MNALGGAIISELGALTISNSTVSGNQASATAPNGRFADSGAMFVEGGSLTMSNTTVTDNRASLAAALPNSVDLLAIAGGLRLGIGTPTIVDALAQAPGPGRPSPAGSTPVVLAL
jgi:hypothetical protein